MALFSVGPISYYRSVRNKERQLQTISYQNFASVTVDSGLHNHRGS